MRLIDADEVMRILDRNAKRYPYRRIGRIDTYSPYNEAWTDAINQVDAEISVLPTITPERKRGRWMPHEDEDGEHYGDKCSVCGEWYVMPYGKTNFCPACGAYMGEKGGE